MFLLDAGWELPKYSLILIIFPSTRRKQEVVVGKENPSIMTFVEKMYLVDTGYASFKIRTCYHYYVMEAALLYFLNIITHALKRRS